jgi:hypothetical protein
VLGAFTRETLMLLPAIALFVGTIPIAYRVGSLLAGVAIHVGIRASLGFEDYDAVMLDENLQWPVLSIAALASVLGFGWIGIAAGVARLGRRVSEPGDSRPPSQLRSLSQFWSWLPVTAAALIPAHFILGRAEEIRISALMAPWAVVLGTHLRIAVGPLIGQFGHTIWWIEFYVQVIAAAGLLAVVFKSRRTAAPSGPASAHS